MLECNHANFVARRGVRVGAVARAGDRWALSGVGGEAAIHDSALASSDVEAARAAAALGEFDAVIVTDASAAQESWHRASAGLPEAFLAMSKRVRDRVRVAMFTAIVAFEARVPVDFDASSFDGGGAIWFAARTNSKPGFKALEKECWTLVSTPAWAAAEVERVPMRDPATGAFIPQSPEVLEAPARALLDAFAAAVGPLPPHTYLHAQRWGSAFPAPLTHGRDADGRSDATKDVLGTAFDASPTEKFAGLGGGGAGDEDFVDGGDLNLYYAGDFCSPRPPGVVAAALSGKHAAEACARRLV
jgi:predicted NAD/FAD-dependent oxidoreductase